MKIKYDLFKRPSVDQDDNSIMVAESMRSKIDIERNLEEIKLLEELDFLLPKVCALDTLEDSFSINAFKIITEKCIEKRLIKYKNLLERLVIRKSVESVCLKEYYGYVPLGALYRIKEAKTYKLHDFIIWYPKAERIQLPDPIITAFGEDGNLREIFWWE